MSGVRSALPQSELWAVTSRCMLSVSSLILSGGSEMRRWNYSHITVSPCINIIRGAPPPEVTYIPGYYSRGRVLGDARSVRKWRVSRERFVRSTRSRGSQRAVPQKSRLFISRGVEVSGRCSLASKSRGEFTGIVGRLCIDYFSFFFFFVSARSAGYSEIGSFCMAGSEAQGRIAGVLVKHLQS